MATVLSRDVAPDRMPMRLFGTQEILYQDPTVSYFSIHADPNLDYPFFWGSTAERGDGSGEGFNHNWPLALGTTDDVFLAALERSNYKQYFSVVNKLW